MAGIMVAVLWGAGMVERREVRAGRMGVRWDGDCQKSEERVLAGVVRDLLRGTYRLGRA